MLSVYREKKEQRRKENNHRTNSTIPFLVSIFIKVNKNGQQLHTIQYSINSRANYTSSPQLLTSPPNTTKISIFYFTKILKPDHFLFQSQNGILFSLHSLPFPPSRTKTIHIITAFSLVYQSLRFGETTVSSAVSFGAIAEINQSSDPENPR